MQFKKSNICRSGHGSSVFAFNTSYSNKRTRTMTSQIAPYSLQLLELKLSIQSYFYIFSTEA